MTAREMSDHPSAFKYAIKMTYAVTKSGSGLSIGAQKVMKVVQIVDPQIAGLSWWRVIRSDGTGAELKIFFKLMVKP